MSRPRTKIVATMGPACRDPVLLERLISAGVDVIRFNLSHGVAEQHAADLGMIRSIADDRSAPLATLADLCGPKVRTRNLDPERRTVRVGDTCWIVRGLEMGDAARFGVNYDGLVEDVRVGHRVLIDDGAVRMLVTQKEDDALVAAVTQGGDIGDHKGVNVPDSDLALPPLTEKDREDVVWAVRREVDFLALSFVRRADDVATLRRELERHGATIPIIAKIETPQAIEALDDIIEIADGILVARGDLGVEMDASRIPMLQKDMVRRCRLAGKPVIVATQMLHSMVSSPSPTRAEVSDVANAVLDGADAVMLSAESSIGRFPVESVATMARIARDANEFRLDEIERNMTRASAPRLHRPGSGPTPGLHSAECTESGGDARPTVSGGDARPTVSGGDARATGSGREDRSTESGPGRETAPAVARSAAMIADDLRASLIVVWCRTGRTAQILGKYQLSQPVIALADAPALCRRLAMSHGIFPMLVDRAHTAGSAPFAAVEQRLVREFDLSEADTIIIVGDPRATDRETTISIHQIGTARLPRSSRID